MAAAWIIGSRVGWRGSFVVFGIVGVIWTVIFYWWFRDTPAEHPAVNRAENGKATAAATFSAPGEYMLRLQANDSSGEGGGGFQCCWTNAHVAVSVK